MGPGPPPRRFDALGASCLPRPSAQRVAARRPSCAFAPLQRRPPQPRPLPSARAPTRHSGLSLLSFVCPATRSKVPAARKRGSTRAPRPRARFGYLLRGPSPRPCRRAKRRSVHGLLPSGRSLRAAAAPLGVAALLSLPAPAPHPRVHAGARPASGPCSRHGSVRSPSLAGRPSVPSWPSPLQSVHSLRPGAALSSRGLPSYPTHGLTLQPGRVSGSCEAEGTAGPSPDCRLSWGSSPCDCRGVASAGAGGWLMVSPRAGRAACAALPTVCTP